MDLGCEASSTPSVWEAKIAEVEGEDAVLFIDGSRGENGRTAGGWSKEDIFEAGLRDGGKYLGEGATVWDGEVVGMAEALENFFFLIHSSRAGYTYGEAMGGALKA